MMSNQSKSVFQLQVGLQANVPQPYDDDEDGADHNTTVDDIEAALTDLQVNSCLINVLMYIHLIQRTRLLLKCPISLI